MTKFYKIYIITVVAFILSFSTFIIVYSSVAKSSCAKKNWQWNEIGKSRYQNCVHQWGL